MGLQSCTTACIQATHNMPDSVFLFHQDNTYRLLTFGRGEAAFFLDSQDMTQRGYWPSQMTMPQQVYHRQATGHQRYLGRELSYSNDNFIRDLYSQQSAGWRTLQDSSWKRKALREELDTPSILRGHKANKNSNLPIKHGKVFHRYCCCIIISQASRHLLM